MKAQIKETKFISWMETVWSCQKIQINLTPSLITLVSYFLKKKSNTTHKKSTRNKSNKIATWIKKTWKMPTQNQPEEGGGGWGGTKITSGE